MSERPIISRFAIIIIKNFVRFIFEKGLSATEILSKDVKLKERIINIVV